MLYLWYYHCLSYLSLLAESGVTTLVSEAGWRTKVASRSGSCIVAQEIPALCPSGKNSRRPVDSKDLTEALNIAR
ncbi:hypothetical protein EMCRGX_G005763 [Ephydatia muelleri]